MSIYATLGDISFLVFMLIVAWLYHKKRITLDTFVISYSVLMVGASLCGNIAETISFMIFGICCIPFGSGIRLLFPVSSSFLCFFSSFYSLQSPLPFFESWT